MKIPFAVALCLLSFGSAFSQFAIQTCPDSLISGLQIRGISLGMNRAETARKLGVDLNTNSITSNLQPDETGTTEWVLYKQDLSKDAGENLRRIHFEYLDDHLVNFRIEYAFDTTWINALDFAHAIGKSLNLPDDLWLAEKSRTPEFAGIVCGDARLMVTWPDLTLAIDDKTAFQTKMKRRQEIEERRKREFKP